MRAYKPDALTLNWTAENWQQWRGFDILDPMKAFAAVLVAFSISMLLAANADATELQIHFQGPDQSKAVIEKADLLLVGWGWVETVDLIPDGNTIRLNFEALAMQSPEKFQNLDSAQIFVRGKNLAAIQSEPFVWPGSGRNGISEETRIDFRGGRSAAVRTGDNAEMTVLMRRPENRRIRFLDEEGKPIVGLKVSIVRFESSQNHCGFLRGEELKAGTTGADGRLTVPDGDFMYALKLDFWSHYNFTSQTFSPDDRDNFVTVFLTQPETVLQLHRMEAVRLALRVFVGEAPAIGVSFTDSRNIGICGAASGPLGNTDSNGSLLVENYFPEERDGICLVDEQGKLLWGKESQDLLQISRNPIEIRLPAGTRFGQTDSPCPFP